MTDSPKPPTVGARIKSARKRANMSQEELGRVLGMDDPRRAASTVSRWERGAGAPQAGTLGKIADALNTSVDWLLSGEDGSHADTAGTTKGEPMVGQELMAAIQQIGAKVEQLRAEKASPERIEDMVDVLASTILHMFRHYPYPEQVARGIAEYMLGPDDPPAHRLANKGQARLPDEPRQARRYSA